MTNDAEAQEIHGTVVSSGPFPEPADQAEVSTPENQEKDEEEERPDATDPGYGRLTAYRGDDDEVVDPDAVVIDQADETPDDEDDEDDDDEAADSEADTVPDDDAAPAPVAGFARTPVASPTAAAADDAEQDDDAEQEAAEVGSDSAVTSATVVTVAGADDVPEADAIAEAAASEPDAAARASAIPEAARPGVPRDAEVPSMSGLAGDPAQLHEQWSAIQSSFVDDPHGSVAAAAELVGEAIAALVAGIQERERGLRGEWDRDGADTEDLRNALRGYRGLLDQLATV